jgi:hypothetical protein
MLRAADNRLHAELPELPELPLAEAVLGAAKRAEVATLPVGFRNSCELALRRLTMIFGDGPQSTSCATRRVGHFGGILFSGLSFAAPRCAPRSLALGTIRCEILCRLSWWPLRCRSLLRRLMLTVCATCSAARMTTEVVAAIAAVKPAVPAKRAATLPAAAKSNARAKLTAGATSIVHANQPVAAEASVASTAASSRANATRASVIASFRGVPVRGLSAAIHVNAALPVAVNRRVVVEPAAEIAAARAVRRGINAA